MKTILTFLLACLLMSGWSSGLASRSLSKGPRDLFPVKQNDKWGYIDNTGKIVIEPQFKSADKFSEGLAVVEVGHRTYGYIDDSGKFVLRPQYRDQAGKFSEGLAFVAIGEGVERKAVYIDKTGKTIIDANLTGGLDFHDGLALVAIAGDESTKFKDKIGYIDKSGKYVINLQFESIQAYDFSGGLAVIEVGGKTGYRVGYIDKTGNLVVGPQFDQVLVREGISLGKNAEFASFSEGLAAVCQGEPRKCGFIDKSGKVVIALQFDIALNFSEGLAVVKIANKYGFIDKSGKVVIKPQFDGSLKFSEGLAWVMVGKMCGYIDETGKMVINPRYDFAFDFSKGLAMVVVGMGRESKMGYIDKTGKYIWNPTN